MNVLKKQLGVAAVLMAGMLFCGFVSATTIQMDFDGLTNGQSRGEYVDNYYNGGCGGSYGGGPVDCGGPNYGVVWTHAIVGGAPNGLFNNVGNGPSAPNVGGFDDNTGAFMNVAAGFDTFSFYYAAANTAGSISVYSDPNGTGSLLASMALPVNGSNCNGASQSYSCWTSIDVSFAGTAKSVNFGGMASYIVFDNVTLGLSTPVNPVPEPATLGMFGLGMLLIGLFAGLHRRRWNA